jgi:hypothetical protein
LSIAVPAWAADTEPAASALPDRAETTHELAGASGELAYTATAGVLPVRPAPDKPEAQVFYVAYVLADGSSAERPLTFLVNGGPGAASVFLHLGGIGPRRLAVDADGTVPRAPVGLEDNPLTWLAFTDLVFIDPVGTGYSAVPEPEPGADDEDKGEQADFWGVRQDLDSLGEFIRLYLTRNGRWPSPKVIAGESYGGFRVAALAKALPEDFAAVGVRDAPRQRLQPAAVGRDPAEPGRDRRLARSRRARRHRRGKGWRRPRRRARPGRGLRAVRDADRACSGRAPARGRAAALPCRPRGADRPAGGAGGAAPR